MRICRRALTDTLNLQEEKQPLIHCISNLVTKNDLAQGILSYCGNPIIANGAEEVIEITSKSNGLYLNLENIDNDISVAMERALRSARRNSIPVVLDVMGMDSSFFRRETALGFLTRYKIDVLKGELSEIKRLTNNGAGLSTEEENTKEIRKDLEMRKKCRELAKMQKNIVVITGKEYYLTDGFSEFFISNGDKAFNKVCGINSILGGLITVGAAVSINKEQCVQSIIVALCTMGISQEISIQRKKEFEGAIALKQYLLDEISFIDSERLEKMSNIKYEFIRYKKYII